MGSPTRYALLTGRYHWRTRQQQGIVGYLKKPLRRDERVPLASLCKQHGYRTAAIRKWRLGWDFQLTDDERKLLKSYGGNAGGGGRVMAEATDADRAVTAWERGRPRLRGQRASRLLWLAHHEAGRTTAPTAIRIRLAGCNERHHVGKSTPATVTE